MISKTEVEDIVKKAVQSLVSPEWLKPDRGWGNFSGVESDLWATAEVIMLLKHPKMRSIYGMSPNTTQEKSLDAIEREATQYIRDSFSENPSKGFDFGGYIRAGETRLDPVSTAFALDVLTRTRPQTQDDIRKIRACVNFLRSTQGNDEGWRYDTRKARPSITVTTAIVTIALANVSLKEDIASLRATNIKNAYAFFNNRRKITPTESYGWPDEGDVPEVRATCYAVYALRKVWKDDTLTEKGCQFIEETRHPNGSWGRQKAGDIEDTSMALLALMSSGYSPYHEVVQGGIEFLIDEADEVKQKFFGWQSASIIEDKSPEVIQTPATYYALSALLEYLRLLDEFPPPVILPAHPPVTKQISEQISKNSNTIVKTTVVASSILIAVAGLLIIIFYVTQLTNQDGAISNIVVGIVLALFGLLIAVISRRSP